VLQGVHQNIPATPPALQQTTAKMLELPPESTMSAPVVKAQTEADRVLERYQSLGKEQNHVYGAYGSSIPNFNVKASGEAQGKPNNAQPSGGATGPNSNSTPAVPVPADTAPSVLGGHPPPPKAPDASPATPRTRPDSEYQPALPLGAPRRKTKGTTTGVDSSTQGPPSARQ
jgi:hypothetical protein